MSALEPVSSSAADYDATALASAATIIQHYSTSFGLAARLLEPRMRTDVRSIYALVRVADELVDGAAAGAGVSLAGQRELLDELEVETVRAMQRGYSTNLIVHAFALTARSTGIEVALITAFFASMRRDLDPTPLSPGELETYIYGSAEVIGLMCLRSFLTGLTPDPAEAHDLENGARRLGAAFQKINFLRDLANDYDSLGRSYFPGIDPKTISEADKIRLLDDIDDDLAAASLALPLLPRGCRAAVRAARDLFARLSHKLRATPADLLVSTRVRVPDREKLMLAVGVLLDRGVRSR
ncbi:phytoene/squalene synthase family protein [Glaciibacter psychrotolerans]|uniref:Phytoene/squalene synthetase n=1 Tax=Glaciibacter psychrotolerans TaxID=670054 RepID=A0A7Z0EFK9_9MICO|nr:squalene/phytoene synthase family protein [Leifsonia psychrotolerans]NYJ20724.1 phytoene/squalene synthetase [Leifsonia psychrotolerans]